MAETKHSKLSLQAKYISEENGNNDDVRDDRFRNAQTHRPTFKDRKLSEKIRQFMEALKDIDDVVDTWPGEDNNCIFVKMSSEAIVSLQDLEASVLDEILLDLDDRKPCSFSSYINIPDSDPRRRLPVLREKTSHTRDINTTSEVKKSDCDIDCFTPTVTDGSNLPPSKEGLSSVKEGKNQNKPEGNEKPSSLLDFLKWRRSSESKRYVRTTSRPVGLDRGACSSNVREYMQRRNSDTSLLGHDLSRLRKLSTASNRSSPSGSTSEIAQLFEKLTRQVSGSPKRNHSEETINFTDGSNKEDCSTSSNSISKEQPNEFSEEDTNSLRECSSVKEGKTMYSSAPNISSLTTMQMDTSFKGEYDPGNIDKVGHVKPGMVRTGSLKVLNFFRNLLPMEKRQSTKEILFPRRLSADSQLTLSKRSHVERVSPHSDYMQYSKRTIKINRPDCHAMYISAADTLGGLPENEEISYPHRYLRSRPHLMVGDDAHDGFNTGRRASCPVILETEESEECQSSRRFHLLSLKVTETEFLTDSSSVSDSAESVHSLDGSDLEGPPSNHMMLGFERFDQIVDAAPSETSSEAPSLLDGVTFIVDRRPRIQQKQEQESILEDNKYNFREIFSSRDNSSISSCDEKTITNLKTPPKKIYKKKKTKQTTKNTHPFRVPTDTSPMLSLTYTVTDKVSSDISEEGSYVRNQSNNQTQTHNKDNNSWLVCNNGRVHMKSLVRDNDSSSCLSDISSNND